MMRPRARGHGALLLVLLLVVPAPAVPQEESSTGAVVGSWEGWATLVNEWPGHPCRYEGSREETSVRLELSPADAGLGGSVAIDLPAAEGSGCPALRKRYAITHVVIGDATVSLTDSGGHEWNLSPQRQGRVLRGMLAWQHGGPESPLADGFELPDGTKPQSRLSGEVRLSRPGADGSDEVAPASADAGAAPAAEGSTSAGQHLGNFTVVLGATAVGLGLLYGVNELGKGSSDEGVVTCSPRRCVVGAPTEPCFCEGNVVSGDSCGVTGSGVQIGGACDWPSMPCEATLSCNSGLCEDRFGRCPY